MDKSIFDFCPDTDYKLYRDSDCPEKNSCIGFSKAVQTPNGIKPCTTIYKCPFDQSKMYKWETPPR